MAKGDTIARDIEEHLPMSAHDFMILMAIVREPLHGYAIVGAVEEASSGRVRIGLGSLYRLIARLMTAGLLEETDPVDPRPHAGRKRRAYRITSLGKRVLAAEAGRMRDAVALARSERLLNDKP